MSRSTQSKVKGGLGWEWVEAGRAREQRKDREEGVEWGRGGGGWGRGRGR